MVWPLTLNKVLMLRVKLRPCRDTARSLRFWWRILQRVARLLRLLVQRHQYWRQRDTLTTHHWFITGSSLVHHTSKGPEEEEEEEEEARRRGRRGGGADKKRRQEVEEVTGNWRSPTTGQTVQNTSFLQVPPELLPLRVWSLSAPRDKGREEHNPARSSQGVIWAPAGPQVSVGSEWRCHKPTVAVVAKRGDAHNWLELNNKVYYNQVNIT